MKDLMIGTDSEAVEVLLLETGGVGKGYSLENEPSKWVRCSQSHVAVALFHFDKPSVCLEEVHRLEDGSRDDGEVMGRGIADCILCSTAR